MLNNRTLQSFLALAPGISMILFMFGYFFFIISFVGNIQEISSSEHLDEPPEDLIYGLNYYIGIIFFIVFLLIILSILAWIFYIIHIAKNPNLEENNQRVIWILVVVFGGGMGIFVYWLAEIVTKNPKPVIP